MPLLTRDVLNRVSFFARRKKQLIYGGIIIFSLAAVLGGFAVYNRSQKNSEKEVPSASSLPKEWILKYFHTGNENDPLVGGAEGDPDGDMLANQLEYLYGTDPTAEDTDKDDVIDGLEVALGENPKGEGLLEITPQAQDYIDDYIASDERFADFTPENIEAQVAGLLQPEQEVVMDVPDDKDIKTNIRNDMSGFEEYYNTTNALTATTEAEQQDIYERLPDGMSAAEIDGYIARLEAAKKILLDTPVPSEIINIHKLKIAQINAGLKLFALARNDYKADSENQQFWHDAFYQISASEAASQLELAAWEQLGLKLKDVGGL